jgi:hypothetical protein
MIFRTILRDNVFRSPEGDGGSTAAAATAATTAPASTTTTVAGGDTPWYQSANIAPEHHDFLRNKEFDSLDTALKSYKSLEGMIGRQRLTVPKDAADAAAYDAIYSTLGRPNDAKGYKLPEGINLEQPVAERFLGAFHKAGLSQAQVESVIKEYHGFGGEATQAKETARLAREQAEEGQLKSAWGDKFDANADLASRAFRSVGIDEATAAKIEEAVGYKAFMEMFHKVGSGMSEGAMKTDGAGGGFTANSVENAKTQRDRMLADPAFTKRYQSSNMAERNKAIEEIQPYIKIIADAKDAARVQGQEYR